MSAIDLIEAKCRLNQIWMAIKTVTDDDFLIFKQVQKDTRRSSKETTVLSSQTANNNNGKDFSQTIEKRAIVQSAYRGVCSNGNKWQVSIVPVLSCL